VAEATVIFADPLKLTPPIVRAVCNVVAVEAFPVNAPTNVVEVIGVAPAGAEISADSSPA